MRVSVRGAPGEAGESRRGSAGQHAAAPVGRRDRVLEVRLLRTIAQASGEQEEYRLLVQAPERESERARRGRIEPLDVVDREDDGPCGARTSSALRTATPSVRGSNPSGSSSTRSAISSARRLGGDNTEHVVEHALEQVAEPSIGEPSLRLSRPRHRTRSPCLRPRRLLARASTSRSPPRLRARARGHRRDARGRHGRRSSSSLPTMLTAMASNNGPAPCLLQRRKADARTRTGTLHYEEGVRSRRSRSTMRVSGAR